MRQTDGRRASRAPDPGQNPRRACESWMKSKYPEKRVLRFGCRSVVALKMAVAGVLRASVRTEALLARKNATEKLDIKRTVGV